MNDPTLEQTATAPDDGRSRPALRVGGEFDHYVIERELGSGGMGVVYAALDTALQRRVALKVLREGLADKAQQRLLREARAMARLSHPNVVTVYEVGSVRGCDFVAMELIDGQPVADWLGEQTRTPAEIVETYLAAGRGLAAAHAAGIVHRDFKPHNVLRSRSARIVVTDFGLARDATDPLATTLPVSDAASSSIESALSGLTVPGALLGTPAYMAPEQWTGGRVTAATDQFAFCVALWEALAGERPYRGQTLEALREQVTRGPATVDDAKLPRHLRSVLRRGLAPDPAARWPSMEALLAHVVPRTRRVALAAIAGAAIVGIAVTVVLTRTTTEPSCRAPAIDPAGVPAANLKAWHEQRAIACTAPADLREVKLTCLDRVLARIDALSRAVQLAPTLADGNAAGVLTVDPAVCDREKMPALPARYSEAAVAAIALHAGGVLDAVAIDRTRTAAAEDPCAALYLALSDVRLADAERAVDACSDDVARAELALRSFARDAEGLDDDKLNRGARDVVAVLDAAGKLDRAWQLDATRASVYRKRRRYDDAIASFDTAIAGASERDATGIAANKVESLLERSRAGDLQLARSEVTKWRAVAERLHDTAMIVRLDWVDATAQWLQGDMTGAHPRLRALQAKQPPVVPAGTRMEGVVVDRKGTPVAGATVVGGYALMGDPISIATPLWAPGNMMRLFETVTTDAKGRFVLEQAPPCYGVLVAQRGGDRSRPTSSHSGARLVLQSTSRVRGRVELGGRVGSFVVGITPLTEGVFGAASVNAPVGPDGRFDIAGIVPGDALIGVGEGGRTLSGHSAMRRVQVRADRALENLVLELPAGREVRVLLRDVTFAGAPVFVIGGRFDGKTASALFLSGTQVQMATSDARLVIGTPPVNVAQSFRDGDLLATFSSAPTGPATVCTIKPFRSCERDIPLVCTPLPANAALVTMTK